MGFYIPDRMEPLPHAQKMNYSLHNVVTTI